MKLNEIIIQNYRKFLNTSLSLSDDVTLLAGANNSGKTSLIDLLKCILESGKCSFEISDIPVTIAKEWVDKVYPIFCEAIDNNNSNEEILKCITDKLFKLYTDNECKNLIPPTIIKFKIDYTDEDDIRNFADYIMDFDENKYSIYFIYIFCVTQQSLRKVFDKELDKIISRYNKIKADDNAEEKGEKEKILKEKIIEIYSKGIIESCYYTDEETYISDSFEKSFYANYDRTSLKEIENISDFRVLFKFKNIQAGRQLDDQGNDSYHNLSKNLIDLAGHEENWKRMINDLPDKIIQPIEEANIKDIVRSASIEVLDEAIKTIDYVNGKNTGKMVIDIDVSENAISSLINNITNAKYNINDHLLSESSQGLGYSNMIYIIILLEKFKREIDPFLVNLFIIEEPESHMHPQMQNVFGKYIRNYYEEKGIQGIITTHSSEMVRVTDMNTLRVVRQLECFKSQIFDFSKFKEQINDDSTLENFYDFFYEIGFSEVVFADRAILYEGDTERLLIRKLSTFDQFMELNQLYIAYIQVGGAYAFNYKELIEFLKIKTLIITDLDYVKTAITKNKILSSETTNETLNVFYNLLFSGKTPTVGDFYDLKNNKKNIMLNGLAFLCYQGSDDRFSRTLEEAMLTKLYNTSAYRKEKKEVWKERKEENRLKFVIPRDGKSCNIRDIVSHSSKTKTNFMYSVILNSLTEKMLPQYIKEGLEWLVKK